MAALTAAITRDFAKWGYSATAKHRVANADVIYFGSFCAFPGTGGLTSRRGYLTTYADVATIEYAGICIGAPIDNLSVTNKITGDTAASPIVQAITEMGPILMKSLAVTGASAQTDVGKPVYLRNDNDMNMTASVAPVVGRVLYWYTSTTVDVLLYGYLSSIVI